MYFCAVLEKILQNRQIWIEEGISTDSFLGYRFVFIHYARRVAQFQHSPKKRIRLQEIWNCNAKKKYAKNNLPDSESKSVLNSIFRIRKGCNRMTRDDFLKQVETGQLLPVYLLLGEETYFHAELIRAYVNKLLTLEDREFNYLSLDAANTDPQEYIRSLETPPFFGPARVIRLNGLENGNAALDEAVLKGLSCLAVGVYQIITAVKLDGRKKLHQEIQRRIVTVECAKLKPFEVPNWIRLQSQKSGLHLSAGQIKTMAERLGNDLRRIHTELEKLKTFTHGKASVSDRDLDALIPGEPEPDIFGLIDAVALRNPGLSMAKLKDLLDSGENELKILATLARQFRNITGALAARRQGMNSKALADFLGINPYVAEKSFMQSGPFVLPELQKILQRLLWADYRMKTGQREPRLELELALIEITTGNFSAKPTNFQ